MSGTFKITSASVPRNRPGRGSSFISAPRSRLLSLFIVLGVAHSWTLHAGGAAALQLATDSQVDGGGVYLSEIATSARPLPPVRLCDAPAFGKTSELSRVQVDHLLSVAAPDLTITNWTGADKITISRRTRSLAEMDALSLLTETLQRDYVKDKGRLELDFTQPWEAAIVPDEPLTVKILELPISGVTPVFIIRFELCTRAESIGIWQASVRAHVWRNVWAAHSNLQRGQLTSEADVDQERRDVLGIHDSLAQFSADDSSLELADGIEAGNVLLARDLKPRPVIHRGQMADALLQDGALNIMMKVEVLEDGAPGQIVRVRNPVSLRSLSGKVVNEQTIAISL
jgi:flagella basal body P-ring formation protein FlgA